MIEPYVKHVIFDLDGTITDSKKGIVNSILYANEKMGIKEKRMDELNCFIGPPLFQTFKSRYLLNDEEANRAVGFYREYFAEKGIFENELYEDVYAFLLKLRKTGYRLYVATAKPDRYAKIILKHFQLMHFFDYVKGANMDGTKSDKTELIKDVLEKIGSYKPSNTFMIGDRYYDMEGANSNGIQGVGVLWGYGTHSELIKAKPAFIAERIGMLEEFLLKNRT